VEGLGVALIVVNVSVKGGEFGMLMRPTGGLSSKIPHNTVGASDLKSGKGSGSI